MARTNIEIDDDLIRAAMRLTKAKTKRQTVEIALRRLVEKGSLFAALRRLEGRLEWEGDVRAWRKPRR
jgi:Arc/MetJ family transcription regulator